MKELTLEGKTSNATRRAALEAAEKHFFDASKPHKCKGFSFDQRDTHHWDVHANEPHGKVSAWLHANPGCSTSSKDGGLSRVFRIRGEPGNVAVFDERWDPYRPHPRDNLTFRTIALAMLWIIEELTQ